MSGGRDHDARLMKALGSVQKSLETGEGRQNVESFERRVVDVPALRARHRLTQQEFADAVGISVGTLRNWEQGRREPEGAARRLLELIEDRPDVAEDMVSGPRRTGDHASLLLAAEFALAAGDWAEARRAIDLIEEDEPSARYCAIMAVIAKGEGQPDEVVRKWLSRALSSAPSRPSFSKSSAEPGQGMGAEQSWANTYLDELSVRLGKAS